MSRAASPGLEGHLYFKDLNKNPSGLLIVWETILATNIYRISYGEAKDGKFSN
jgi:hypothetical protein